MGYYWEVCEQNDPTNQFAVMSYLYKTLWCLALIILAGLLKEVFAYFLPDAVVFIHNFLSLVQYIILLWTVISLLQGPGSSKKRSIKKLMFILLFIAFPELLFTYWLHHPEKIPRSLNSAFKNYYLEAETNIIQFNPNYSVYDSSLFYTLKPSAHFVYDNYEFTDSFNTNSLGLRDDENSLHKPDIICLGDSYAMGWGIPQNETFAEILSTQSGKKILNAAISSYGTAREIKNLYRLDTTNLKHIVLQYCRNDFIENKEFVESNYTLKISPEKKYISAVNTHYWSKLWFPGKHFIGFCKLIASRKLFGILNFNKSKTADSSLTDLHQTVLTFVDLLAHSSINFYKVKVFVVDLNEKGSLNNNFINEANTVIKSPEYKKIFNNNLIMVPVADLITENDYYILDAHMRVSGQRKIAKRLYDQIFFSQ